MLVNVTPHTINVILPDGSTMDIPPSGTVARVASQSVQVGDVDGIPVFAVAFGDITGLPEPQDGTVFVASTLVAQAAAKAGRKDVLSPQTVRDSDGNIVGCNGFQTFA